MLRRYGKSFLLANIGVVAELPIWNGIAQGKYGSGATIAMTASLEKRMDFKHRRLPNELLDNGQRWKSCFYFISHQSF